MIVSNFAVWISSRPVFSQSPGSTALQRQHRGLSLAGYWQGNSAKLGLPESGVAGLPPRSMSGEAWVQKAGTQSGCLVVGGIAEDRHLLHGYFLPYRRYEMIVSRVEQRPDVEAELRLRQALGWFLGSP